MCSGCFLFCSCVQQARSLTTMPIFSRKAKSFVLVTEISQTARAVVGTHHILDVSALFFFLFVYTYSFFLIFSLHWVKYGPLQTNSNFQWSTQFLRLQFYSSKLSSKVSDCFHSPPCFELRHKLLKCNLIPPVCVCQCVCACVSLWCRYSVLRSTAHLEIQKDIWMDQEMISLFSRVIVYSSIILVKNTKKFLHLCSHIKSDDIFYIFSHDDIFTIYI